MVCPCLSFAQSPSLLRSSHSILPAVLRSRQLQRRSSYRLQKLASSPAVAQTIYAAGAVAEKPEAETSGEFGDYDDLLARFRRADLDGGACL